MKTIPRKFNVRKLAKDYHILRPYQVVKAGDKFLWNDSEDHTHLIDCYFTVGDTVKNLNGANRNKTIPNCTYIRPKIK